MTTIPYSPPTDREQQQMRQYLLFMEEVRIRLDVLTRTLKNEVGFFPQMVREICFLQFRFLCEIIALACLVAHGYATKKLMDTWEADKIVNEMQKLKPGFYPHPCDVRQTENSVDIRPSSRPHLTRENLAQLWGRSGDVLHRAPLSKFTKARRRDPSDLSDVMQWADKFSGLLSSHYINVTETRGLLVELSTPKTGKPTTYVLDFVENPRTVNVTIFKSV